MSKPFPSCIVSPSVRLYTVSIKIYDNYLTHCNHEHIYFVQTRAVHAKAEIRKQEAFF
jgi:hypothetical protein